LLLELHVEMAKDFGISQQDKINLDSKKAQYKSKLENDRKNMESKLAKKRLAEEEERKDVAKNQKIVAEQSTRMMDCFEQMLKMYQR
jgi:hypothetical protein